MESNFWTFLFFKILKPKRPAIGFHPPPVGRKIGFQIGIQISQLDSAILYTSCLDFVIGFRYFIHVLFHALPAQEEKTFVGLMGNSGAFLRQHISHTSSARPRPQRRWLRRVQDKVGKHVDLQHQQTESTTRPCLSQTGASCSFQCLWCHFVHQATKRPNTQKKVC